MAHDSPIIFPYVRDVHYTSISPLSMLAVNVSRGRCSVGCMHAPQLAYGVRCVAVWLFSRVDSEMDVGPPEGTVVSGDSSEETQAQKLVHMTRQERAYAL